jgi:hypothetical protein
MAGGQTEKVFPWALESVMCVCVAVGASWYEFVIGLMLNPVRILSAYPAKASKNDQIGGQSSGPSAPPDFDPKPEKFGSSKWPSLALADTPGFALFLSISETPSNSLNFRFRRRPASPIARGRL